MKRLLNFENEKNTLGVITIELLDVDEGIAQLKIINEDIVENKKVYEDNMKLELLTPVYSLDNIEVGSIKIAYFSDDFNEEKVIELVKGFLLKYGSIKNNYNE